MTGYVRIDTINNIADGNVISAADLDGEFNGVQAAFNSSTGHTHDGTASEGAPITKLGPVQDVTISTTVLGVKTTNTVDLGTSSLKFKDFYLAGNASIGGTLGVTSTATFTGAVIFNGNATIGDADTDTITQAASYVTGTQLKSAKTATNTLSLAAYDVDGTAYTNLITLTAANEPTLALTSIGVGTINKMSIGATTASTGAFTTLTSNGATTFTAGTASTTTGTGTLVITGGLGVSGRINATNFDGIIGANTAAAGSFTTLTSTGASSFATSSGDVGIGTSSPAFKLDVGGGDGTNIALRSTGTSQARLRGYVNGAESGVIGFLNGGGQVFEVAGTEAMRLTSTSLYTASTINVGIGTSSPVAKLQIKGSGTSGQVTSSFILENNSSGTLGMDITGTAGSSYWRLLYGGGPSTGTNALSLGMSMVIEGASAGYVGIGTNGPTRKLYVQSDDSATGGNVVAVRNANSTAGAFINFLAGGGNAPSMGAKGNDLVFTADGYAGTEWARFSSGNLGVGVTPSTSNTAGASFVPGTSTVASMTGSNGSGQLLLGNNGNGSNLATNDSCGMIAFKGRFNSTFGGGNDIASIIGTYTGNGTTRSGAIRFLTLDSGTEAERARINADGVFQVAQTDGVASDGKLQVLATGTGSGAANTKVGLTIKEADSGNAAGIWLGSMTNGNTGVIGSRTATGNIAFQTYNGGWGERMRLTYDGSLLVGTTSDSGTLTVKGTSTARAGTVISLTDSSAGNLFKIANDGLITTGGAANPYGNTTATGANAVFASDGVFYRSTSALKYKQDIRDIESIDIAKFRPIRYKSKCNGDDQTLDHFGIVADEVDQAGIKELVSYGIDGQVEGFQYERLTVVLLKAIQEQQALITTLTARITALEGA